MRLPFGNRRAARFGLRQHASSSASPEDEWFEVQNLSVGYGAVPVLRDVSLTVAPGEVVAVIGPNGAGKSTLLRAISGLIGVQAGAIRLDGSRLDKLSPHAIVARGVVQIPEGRHLFSDMSVHDNLVMGAHLRRDTKLIREDLQSLEGRFPVLETRRKQRAGTASGGEQQMIAIARALMARPRLLLLDEPSIGLAPRIVRDLGKIIHEVRQGYETSILLIEQNARMALAASDRAYVMELGRVALSGPSQSLLHDERVRQSYLAG